VSPGFADTETKLRGVDQSGLETRRLTSTVVGRPSSPRIRDREVTFCRCGRGATITMRLAVPEPVSCSQMFTSDITTAYDLTGATKTDCCCWASVDFQASRRRPWIHSGLGASLLY